MPFLRQSTAQTIRFGPCLDKTDGVTEETALTLAQADMRLSKDGGAYAQKSAAGNATHDSDGWYSTSLSTTDTNTVGELKLNVHQPANMLPVWEKWYVIEEAIYDALFAADAAGYNTTTPPTVGAIANEHLNRALSGHQTQGTVGAAATIGAYAGRRGPGIYIDDAAGNTNTVIGTDGTLEHPVSTIAAASTLATNMGIHRFYLVNDTLITLAASYEGYEFIGIGLNNQVTLGTQDVDNAFFESLTLTGTQGGTGLLFAKNCTLTGLLAYQAVSDNCWLLATNTLRAATNHMFTNCQSGVAGAATPILVFPGAGTTDLSFRHYSGGLEVQSAVGTNTMSYEADGQLIIAASCVGLVVSVRGALTITNNGSGTVITADAALSRSAIADAVSEEPLEDHVSQGTVGWVSLLSAYDGPEGPGIYLDSGSGNTNTVNGTDGTVANPVSTFAAARTLANSIGLDRYYLEGNSDLTLAATHVDWEFVGVGAVGDNIVNLGTQDVSRSRFHNLILEGVQSGSDRMEAVECALQDPGAGATRLHIFALRCGLVDRIEVDTSNNNVFESCFSLVAGATTPVIVATGAAGTIELRHYSGGIEFESLSASHNLSIEGMGQVIFNANCNVNANVSMRGLFTITDNTAGMASLTQEAVFNRAAVESEVNDALVALGLDHLVGAAVVGADVVDNSIMARLVSASGTADWDDFVNTTDSLQALADALVTIDDFLDTEIAAILAAVDTEVQAILDLVGTDGVELSAAAVDAIWDEVMSGHTTAGTFGDRLRAHLNAYLQTIVSGTPTTTVIQLNGATGINGGAPNANDDFYNGRVVFWLTGNAAGQATDVSDYDGGTTTLTVTALAVAPASGDLGIMV